MMKITSPYDVQSSTNLEVYKNLFSSPQTMTGLPDPQHRAAMLDALHNLIRGYEYHSYQGANPFRSALEYMQVAQDLEAYRLGLRFLHEGLDALSEGMFQLIRGTLSRDYSREELIQNFDYETSVHPHVVNIRQVPEGIGFSERLRRFNVALACTVDPAYSFGYVAPSLMNDSAAEDLLTRLIAETLKELQPDSLDPNHHGVRPLIIPIDEFYSYYTQDASIVEKICNFSGTDQFQPFHFDSQGRRFFLILTGFSRSGIFNDDVLLAAPNVRSLYKPETATEKKEIIQQLSTYLLRGGVIDKLFEKYGNVQDVLNHLMRNQPEAERDNARLLLGTSLLSRDPNGWQRLWYEGLEHGGAGLYIVAPTIFHKAQVGVTLGCGPHGEGDYIHRTTIAGSTFCPEGVNNYLEMTDLRKPLSLEGFYERVKGLLV